MNTFFKLSLYSGAVLTLADHSEIHVPIAQCPYRQVAGMEPGFDFHSSPGDGFCQSHSIANALDDATRARYNIPAQNGGVQLRSAYVTYVRQNAFNSNASRRLKYAIQSAVLDRLYGTSRAGQLTNGAVDQWARTMNAGAWGDDLDAKIMANMLGVKIVIRHMWESVQLPVIAEPFDVEPRFTVYIFKNANHYSLLSLTSERDQVHVAPRSARANNQQQQQAKNVQQRQARVGGWSEQDMQAAIAASIASHEKSEAQRKQRMIDDENRALQAQFEAQYTAAQVEAQRQELLRIEAANKAKEEAESKQRMIDDEKAARALQAQFEAEYHAAQVEAQRQELLRIEAAHQAKKAAERKARMKADEELARQLHAQELRRVGYYGNRWGANNMIGVQA